MRCVICGNSLRNSCEYYAKRNTCSPECHIIYLEKVTEARSKNKDTSVVYVIDEVTSDLKNELKKTQIKAKVKKVHLDS